MKQTLRQKSTLKPALRIKLGARLKMAQILEGTEEEILQAVRKTEGDPLFRELVLRGGVKRKRFGGVSPSFFRIRQLKEEFAVGPRREATGVASEETVALVEKLGRDNFTAFFLAPEKIYTVREVSRATGLDRDEIGLVADFANNFTATGFPGRLTGHPPPGGEATRIVAVVTGPADGLMLEEIDFDLCRGEYRLDDRVIREIKDSLPPGRKQRFNRIVANLRWINSRRSTIYSILTALLERQKEFILSGLREDLQSLTQVQLGREIEIHPSLVSRAIKGRALKLPGGEIAPLKEFFPGRREEVKRAIGKIIRETPGEKMSDARIASILERDYNISIPRRTVNSYRNSKR